MANSNDSNKIDKRLAQDNVERAHRMFHKGIFAVCVLVIIVSLIAYFYFR